MQRHTQSLGFFKTARSRLPLSSPSSGHPPGRHTHENTLDARAGGHQPKLGPTAMLHPVSRTLQNGDQLPLPRALFLAQVRAVLPPRRLGKTHEDALDARAGGHQPKLGPAVIHEVELDVAAAAEELPAPLALLALREGLLDAPARDHAALEDGEVRWDEGVTARA